MKHKPQGEYSQDWLQIAKTVKAAHNKTCERCHHPDDPRHGYLLTVHHLDGDKSNNALWNLSALCQRCHLAIQGKVFLPQFYMFEHSDWFKPHVDGYLESLKEGK